MADSDMASPQPSERGARSSSEDGSFPAEGWAYGNTGMGTGMPGEMIKEMADADPAFAMYEDMRRQAAAAAAVTTNATARVGSSVVCTSVHDLKAAAKDVLQIGRKRSQYSDGTFECEEYVDYAVACDLDRRETSCNNRYASRMMKNFNRALSVYNCKSYSRIWTCDNCTMAYKRWLCGTIYRKYMIPDTAYHEEGTVRQGSTACKCPIMDANEAVAAPLCVNICNGLPQDCDMAAEPTCPRAACGSAGGAADPGRWAPSDHPPLAAPPPAPPSPPRFLPSPHPRFLPIPSSSPHPLSSHPPLHPYNPTPTTSNPHFSPPTA